MRCLGSAIASALSGKALSSTRKLDGTDAANPNATTNIWRVNADGTDPRALTRATALNAGSYGPRFTR